MNKVAAFITALVLIFFIAACAQTPMAEPLTPRPTRIAFAAPTDTPPPTETPTPTEVPPTLAPPTETPTLTPMPTPTLPPGLFVTDLKTQPDPAPRGTDLQFFATFLNTTGTAQSYRWLVYIYRSENRVRSYSETTATLTGIPVGSSEQKSLGSWKLGVGGPCEDFVARVAFLDQDNKATNFAKPDGQVFEKDFRVCPASELPPPPTATPTATPAGPTATPVIAPGSYVVAVDLSPERPAHGEQITFAVTFANTMSTEQTFRWLVYIYKSDTPQRSFSETSVVQTAIPIAATEHKALGYWKIGSTGYQCDQFSARVAWLDQNNKATFFLQPDGKVFEKPFAVCN